MALNLTGGLANGLGNQNIGGLRYNVTNTFHYADNLTLIRGRHMIKTGGQFMRVQANVFFAGNNGRVGFMNFSGQYTAGPNASSPTSPGLADADFLLGYPTTSGRRDRDRVVGAAQDHAGRICAGRLAREQDRSP